MSKATRKTTAELCRQRHQERCGSILDKLEQIQRNVEDRQNEGDNARLDWTHVGTLGHVDELLNHVTQALGITFNREGV